MTVISGPDPRSLLDPEEMDMRQLFDAMPQLGWSSRPDGYITRYNRGWYEYTGLTYEQMAGWGWEAVHDPTLLPRVLENWQYSLKTGTPFEMEFTLRRHDGARRWFLTRATPVRNEAGDIVRWIGINTDIHQQKETARRSQFLNDAAVLLTSSLDYQKTLNAIARLAVPEFCDFCTIDMLSKEGGFERVAVAHIDPLKISTAEMLARKLPPKPSDPTGFFHVVRTGQPEFYGEIPDELLGSTIADPDLLAAARALGLKSAIAVPLPARGRTLGVLTFVYAESGNVYLPSDVGFAEQLARQAGLAVDNSRLYQEAQDASRLKDEFLSTVSHELRTPLTAILGWARILAVATSLEKAHKAASTIERNARAQAQLIEDLLDVSRIVSGKLRLDVRPVDLVGVLEAAIESAQPAADAKEIRVQRILDPKAATVHGDGDRLQQVAWNLLSNAIKFTPRGGRVTLQLSRVNSHVEMEVSDTGEGIHADFLPNVFERFRQGDGSVGRQHQGLGLGLAITRHLVELHGGSVHASSPGLGHGSTFVVKLPRAAVRNDSPAEGREHPTAHVPLAARDAPAIVGARVLLVDDQPDTVEVLSEVLRAVGAVVTKVSSADAAEKAFAEASFDVLVSDVGMPGRDGYDLIRAVRRLPLDIDIAAVAVTAYARAEDRTHALRSGFDAHVAKPVEPGELIEVIGALLRRRRPMR